MHITHLKELIQEQQGRLDRDESVQAHDEAKAMLDTAIARLERVQIERVANKEEKAELSQLRAELQSQQKEILAQLGELKRNGELARQLLANRISPAGNPRRQPRRPPPTSPPAHPS